MVARSIAGSNLLKAAVLGADPNWGRIACAAGYSGAALDRDLLDVTIGAVPVVVRGLAAAYDQEAAAAEMRQDEVRFAVDLHLGDARHRLGLRPDPRVRAPEQRLHHVTAQHASVQGLPTSGGRSGRPAGPPGGDQAGGRRPAPPGGRAGRPAPGPLRPADAPILVHGGGPVISAWLQRLGKEPVFVGGLRQTDAETLDIAVMALAGKVNTDLVAVLQVGGTTTFGLSGVDGGFIRARRQTEPDLGFVGVVEEVDPRPLEALASAGYVP